jgi:hypothetical protein
VGVPLSDDNIGGGLEKDMFETAFGPEMVDKFYPSFDKIFDYASKRNVKLNTKSRRMDSDPPQPSEKFLAESAQVFRYISSQLVADRLLNANMKSAGKDQGLITYKGDPTGVGFDRFAKNAFSNTWPTYWIQDKRLRSKAESLDSSQYLLNSREKMDYRSSQDDAVSIALNNGRQKLLSIIDNDEDNGVARFASGGSVFTPRGTDTVPAMLTPGEFVMKKSAVDKYGVGFMSSINEGRGSSRGGYMHEGGVASGSVSQFGDVATATKADPAISKIERTGTATLNKMTGMDKSLQSSTATIQETTSKTKADTSNIIASLFDLNDSITKEIKDGSISGGSISDEQLDLLGAQMDEFVQALLPVRQAIENIAGQMPAHVQMLKDFTADWVNLGMENRLDVINAKQGAAFVSHLTIMNKSKGNFGKLAGAFPGINLGGAAPAFMATGGMARGTDTVPAMLTPGEFVMKKSAVDKYGVGFMRGVNNGVQGFAKGGPVQYLQKGSKNRVASQSDALGGGGGDGGGFGEMVSLISSSLDAFNQAFTAFSGLSTMLGNIINSISNLNITHTINLQGALNIPGFSKEAIDNIVTTITDQTIVKTDEQIRNALSQLNIDNDNRADA